MCVVCLCEAPPKPTQSWANSIQITHSSISLQISVITLPGQRIQLLEKNLRLKARHFRLTQHVFAVLTGFYCNVCKFKRNKKTKAKKSAEVATRITTATTVAVTTIYVQKQLESKKQESDLVTPAYS